MTVRAVVFDVGETLVDDVRPPAAAGLVAVFIRRGPWGWIVDDGSRPREAALAIESLAELPEALRTLDDRARPRAG